MERRHRLRRAYEDRRFQPHGLVGEPIALQLPLHLAEQRIQQIAKAVMMAFQSLQENLVGSRRKLIKGFMRLERRRRNRIEHRPRRRRAAGNEIVFGVRGICLAKRPQRLVLEQSETMQVMAEAEWYAVVVFVKHRIVQIQPCSRRKPTSFCGLRKRILSDLCAHLAFDPLVCRGQTDGERLLGPPAQLLLD